MTRLVVRPYAVRDAEFLRQSGLHPLLARLYAARGVSRPEEIAASMNRLVPPGTLTGADAAAEFLSDAIDRRKRMVVIADYDCDGATACAVMLRGLRAMGADVDYIVPNRFEYGYGLTPDIVALALREKSPEVLITVDNGIASVEGVAAARQRGLDVLVTDHHLPGAELPAANVIVNPNQPGCGFPSKHLAGVGVAFYVLLALRARLRERGRFTQQDQPRLDSLLDLVALGTVADVVRLDANNRLLVAEGLKRMRALRMQPGVAALFRIADREARQATAFDLGFALGPRLNAAGRLDDMSLGIECLITDDEGRAWALAQQLDAMNRERRTIEQGMQEEAMTALEGIDPQAGSTIAMHHPSWHQGVIGIVASRLKERFYRPTITFAPAGDGQMKGSGRSIDGFHLRDALDLVSKRAPGVIERFGGHAMAAGLTIREDRFDAFRQAFEAVGQSLLSASQLERVLETDGPLEDAYMTTDCIALLEAEVWGQGFPAPVFCDEFRVISQRVLKDRHLKLQLERNGRRFDAIWFGSVESPGEHARIAYRLDANAYNGVTRVQLLVQHAEPARAVLP